MDMGMSTSSSCCPNFATFLFSPLRHEKPNDHELVIGPVLLHDTLDLSRLWNGGWLFSPALHERQDRHRKESCDA